MALSGQQPCLAAWPGAAEADSEVTDYLEAALGSPQGGCSLPDLARPGSLGEVVICHGWPSLGSLQGAWPALESQQGA